MTEILDKFIRENSVNECSGQYHRWAFLSIISACLGRRVYFNFGHENLYPTMYVVLVGLSASRKSTAIKISQKLLKESGYDNFAFTKTSREKFLMDLNEGFQARNESGELDLEKALLQPMDKKSTSVRECFICADELLDFLGMKNFNFLSTLTTLWDNLDYYPERLKNSISVNIPKPTINLLGGFTPQNLSLSIPAEMIGQGATSRFIFVHSPKPTKKVTFPKALKAATKNEVVEFLKVMQSIEGECQITAGAENLVDTIYKNFEELPDARLNHYCSRRLSHLLKLCVTLSAMNEDLIINEEVVEQANTILTYTEASMTYALGEFGEGKNAKASQRVMEVLQAADKPLTIYQLWARVTQDIDRVHTLGEILENLRNAKKILKSENNEGEMSFLLNRNITSKKKPGVNYSKWIQEYEGE